jgi:hypothetical protein
MGAVAGDRSVALGAHLPHEGEKERCSIAKAG